MKDSTKNTYNQRTLLKGTSYACNNVCNNLSKIEEISDESSEDEHQPKKFGTTSESHMMNKLMKSLVGDSIKSKHTDNINKG